MDSDVSDKMKDRKGMGRAVPGALLAAALVLGGAGAGAGAMAPAGAGIPGGIGVERAYAAWVWDPSLHGWRNTSKYAIGCWQKSKGSRTVCVSFPNAKKAGASSVKRVKVAVKSLSGKRKSTSKAYSIAQVVKKGKIAIRAKALGSVKVAVSFYGKKGRPKKLAKTVTRKIRLSCAHHSWKATGYRTVAVPTKYKTVHHEGEIVGVVCNMPILIQRFRECGNDMDAFNSWLDEHGVPNRCFSRPISDYFGGKKSTYVYTYPKLGIHAGDEVGAEFEHLGQINDYNKEQSYIYYCNKQKYIPELRNYDNTAVFEVEVGAWDEKVLVSKAHQEKTAVAWKCAHCGAEK